MEIPEIRGTLADEIQQAQLVENAESLQQAVRHSALTSAVNAPVEQVLPVTQLQVMEWTVHKFRCTPHDVATGGADLKGQKSEVAATGVKRQKAEVVAIGETDLQGKKLEIMATGETDLEAREEIAGRVLSACTDFRKLERLLW